jgi:mycothiol synthase
MKYEVVRKVDGATLTKIANLLDASRDHDGHAPLGEHKWLDLHSGKDGFAGIVAEDDGEVVGYAHLSRHGPGWGLEAVVHPKHRHGPISDELIRRALDVVKAEGGGHVHYWVFRPDESRERLAQELGFRAGRDLLHVCVPLPVDYHAPLPPGIRLRAFEPGRDDEAWLDVNNRAFADHPEQSAWDEAMLERRMKEQWFDPNDFLIATDDAGIAGFNWTKLYRVRGEGEIYVIGVDPNRPASGLGKALLVAGLQHMARKGMHTCCLYVDEANEKALAMYDKFGFKEDHRDRAYAIDVGAR